MSEERKKFTLGSLLPWHNDHEGVIWVVLILMTIGMLNIFSSTFIKAENDFGNPYYYLKRHGISLVLSLIVMFISSRTNYHRWRHWIVPVGVAVLLSVLAASVAGPEINGARRWLVLGTLSVQPSEFAKLITVIISAYYLSYQLDKNKPIVLVSRLIFIIIAFAVAVETGPDLGTAAVVFGVPIIMMLLAGMSYKLIAILTPILLAGGYYLCTLQDYRMARMNAFLNPWSDPQGFGFQTVRSLTAIGSGGFSGMGLGHGLSKYDYLPEAHTDFAFAVFSQENGFICVCGVLLLYGMLMLFSTRIANNAPDTFGQLLATGIMVLIVGQATVNMMMVSGFFPVVGVPLPFISYAGSALLMSSFAVGLLYNIGKSGYEKQLQEQEQEPPPVRRISKPKSSLKLVK